jgi:hypothetical protein
VSDRSAKVGAGFTVVVAVALLFAVFGSEVVELTVAVFESGPAVVGVTLIVIDADAPLAREGSEQVSAGGMPEHVHGSVEDSSPTVTPAGSVSVSVTAAAASGPAFATVIV